MDFTWIIKNKLAASSIPLNISDIEYIAKQGIKEILCLVEEHELPFNGIKEYEKYLKFFGINLKHIPIIDGTAPDLNNLEKIVKFIEEKIKQNKKVLVHCYGGLGRTGTIVSAYLIYSNGYTAEEAISYVRKLRPGSVQSFVQEYALIMFEKNLNR